MKPTILLAILLVVAGTSALARPITHEGYFSVEEIQAPSVHSRSRRDLTGLFDSLAYGVDGLANGFNTVGKSVMQAFDSVFSRNNLNAVTNGLMAFRNGVKDALHGFFGGVSKGFKKVGDKMSGAYKNDNSQPDNSFERGVDPGLAPRTEPPERQRARNEEATTKANKFNGAIIIIIPHS